jgi:hypothetical protein
MSPGIADAWRLVQENSSASKFHKSNAAALDALWVPPDAAAPADVIKAFGRAVGAELSGSGFKYVHSRRSVERKEGDLHYALRFETSRYNLAGVHVGCRLIFSVNSPLMNSWLKSDQPSRLGTNTEVLYARAERIIRRAGLFAWDLAVAAHWDRMVAATALACREIGEPWFDEFAAFLAAPPADRPTRITAVQPYYLVRALLVLRSPEEASMLLSRVLAIEGDLAGDFVQASKGTELRGRPGATLYRMAERYGLEWSDPAGGTPAEAI